MRLVLDHADDTVFGRRGRLTALRITDPREMLPGAARRAERCKVKVDASLLAPMVASHLCIDEELVSLGVFDTHVMGAHERDINIVSCGFNSHDIVS